TLSSRDRKLRLADSGPRRKTADPRSGGPPSVLRHRGLGFLEVLGCLVLHAVLQRLVALVVELLRLTEILSLGLRLLDLRPEVLLERVGGLGVGEPRGERQAEQTEADGAAHERSSSLPLLPPNYPEVVGMRKRVSHSAVCQLAVLPPEEQEGPAPACLGVLHL